jgi:hypothetical protein
VSEDQSWRQRSPRKAGEECKEVHGRRDRGWADLTLLLVEVSGQFADDAEHELSPTTVREHGSTVKEVTITTINGVARTGWSP